MELSAEERATIAKEPPLGVWERLAVQAWSDLGSDRPIGMAGAGAIPWSSVMWWCEFHSLTRDESQLVVDALRVLDNHRAERLAKQ